MRYRKKPVVIEAWRWDGQTSAFYWPKWLRNSETVMDRSDESTLLIRTLEGTMKADSGDWIIQGVKGEIYPCKPDIFEATYEAVE